jgi:hypothetical protein
MSDYKEYRSKQRTWARVLTEDVKVIVKGDDDTYSEAEMKAGDYEVKDDDGRLSYWTKQAFDSVNEPVRRERVAKATGKGKGSGSSKSKEKAAAAPAAT